MKFLSYPDKLRLFWKASMNMTYLGGNTRLSPPIIAWMMTKRCNLTCKHCTSYLSYDKIERDKLMQVAEKIAASDTMIIIMTGGEPMLLPNIKEIISLLKSKGKILKINTNGYNLDKYADFLIHEKVDCVAVSMDGVDANTHDEIRGKKGSYSKALKNLEYLKKHRKNGKPQLAVRGVLMKENFKMMPDYIEYFGKVVDEVSFQPIHDNSSHHQVVDHDVLFSPRDIHFEKQFEQMMYDVAAKYPEFNNDYYKSFPQFIFHPDQMEEKALHTCLPTWMNFMPITDDGTCHTCTQVIGNVFDNDIDAIWTGEKRIGFLRSMAKFGKCKSPCWLNCTGVAPGWIGTGIKTLLKLGQENEASRQEFLQMPNYTGEIAPNGI